MLGEKEIREIHEQVLYPIVRVRTEKAGGTGLIVYSKPTPEDATVYETYIVTCHHVIEDAVKFVKKWSSIARREIKVEERQQVQIETFKYEKLSRCIGGTTYNSDIVSWNKDLDIAVLRVRCEEQFKYVAKLYPKDKADDIFLGRTTIACGCSLGHAPLFTIGNLVAKHDMIKNKEYWMNTANTIFGNSGGAVFLGDTYEYVGITAMITAIQMGFSIDIVTWMGFFVPITTIYKFMDDEFLQFIYDPKFTSTQCTKLRKSKEEREESKLLIPQTE